MLSPMPDDAPVIRIVLPSRRLPIAVAIEYSDRTLRNRDSSPRSVKEWREKIGGLKSVEERHISPKTQEQYLIASKQCHGS